METAGILDVFQGFHGEKLGQQSRISAGKEFLEVTINLKKFSLNRSGFSNPGRFYIQEQGNTPGTRLLYQEEPQKHCPGDDHPQTVPRIQILKEEWALSFIP